VPYKKSRMPSSAVYQSPLPFARRYRPASFESVVGQELVVRLLKNSLYRQLLFPVYLLAGQRGCGKTTIARLFAAAVNCNARPQFVQNPTSTLLPCGSCQSCTALVSGQHPDVYEIDAASYTGVDHIRALAETATLAPQLGSHKVFLIDEAHMLSRASFNALLKLLEEPPTNVLFLLVTTDPEKIIETVRSRSFQLQIKPLPTAELTKLLESICTTESIQFEPKAIALVAAQSDGSAREALNLLEQVLRTDEAITITAVRAACGLVPAEQLKELLHQIVCASDCAAFVTWWQQQSVLREHPKRIWQQLVTHLTQQLTLVPIEQLTQYIQLLQLLYDHELRFSRSANQAAYLEMVCISAYIALHNSTERAPVKSAKSTPPQTNSSAPRSNVPPTPATPPKQAAAAQPTAPIIANQPTTKVTQTTNARWQEFLAQIETVDDQLVLSLYGQALYNEKLSKPTEVVLDFDKDLTFLRDIIEQKRTVWQQRFAAVYGADTKLTCRFVLDAFSAPTPKPAVVMPAPQPAARNVPPSPQKNTASAPSAQNRYGARKPVSRPVPAVSPDIKEFVARVNGTISSVDETEYAELT
jgi:DNA polymerase-3 subunit gamma/tau